MVMWKRILITSIAIIGVITSGYGYYHFQINAAGSYAVAAQSTGRIGLLKQGDRIYMGTQYNGNNIEMQLLKPNPNGSGSNVWLSMRLVR